MESDTLEELYQILVQAAEKQIEWNQLDSIVDSYLQYYCDKKLKASGLDDLSCRIIKAAVGFDAKLALENLHAKISGDILALSKERSPPKLIATTGHTSTGKSFSEISYSRKFIEEELDHAYKSDSTSIKNVVPEICETKMIIMVDRFQPTFLLHSYFGHDVYDLKFWNKMVFKLEDIMNNDSIWGSTWLKIGFFCTPPSMSRIGRGGPELPAFNLNLPRHYLPYMLVTTLQERDPLDYSMLKRCLAASETDKNI